MGDHWKTYVDGDELSHSRVHGSNSSYPVHHPVKKNYRKVHVTILHWEVDELHDLVRTRHSRLRHVVNSFETGQTDI